MSCTLKLVLTTDLHALRRVLQVLHARRFTVASLVYEQLKHGRSTVVITLESDGTACADDSAKAIRYLDRLVAVEQVDLMDEV